MSNCFEAALPAGPIAESAARVGVGEKRMRAVIREIFPMPAPPDEFVAIQVSRIVQELDRYHGFSLPSAAGPNHPPGSRSGGSRRPPKERWRSARRSSAARNFRCKTVKTRVRVRKFNGLPSA